MIKVSCEKAYFKIMIVAIPCQLGRYSGDECPTDIDWKPDGLGNCYFGLVCIQGIKQITVVISAMLLGHLECNMRHY